MDDRKKFLLVEGIIFTALGIITLIEISNFLLFKEFFMRIREYLSWFLGLAIAPVLYKWFKYLEDKFEEKYGLTSVNEKFLFFLINLVFLTFAVGFAKELAIFFLKKYFEFFHIIFTQWLVVVYIWFKFVNNFKINMEYIITAEILVILFSIIITLIV